MSADPQGYVAGLFGCAGKRVIVTGAAEGLGKAMATGFARAGARVLIADLNADGLAETARELGGITSDIASCRTDVTSVADVEALFALAAEHFGGVDVLVNNAGLDLAQDFLDTDEGDARRIFETNVFGTLWMLRRVARELSESGRGGSIVNVSSRLASIGMPRMVVYGASKGAVLALTRGAAVELAPLGIRVNAVAPGMAATPMFKTYIAEQADGEDTRRRIVDAIPQGRLAEPEDVAAAVAYLAADESAHVTGASIPIDGGYTAA
jgi:NAD(P)-dependent dehydrogenase (short-subunit alcohol dehydrogenase family)